ncbi:hypothetical protein SAMN05421788_11431 [Filimonas lacunae]|uniref:DUF1735 domain-containing protein n=1 Tax=Filimonas lacunae TaxID=477680 RepID=A0A173MM43_9BACT|nr:hypothetical protein [Filimonas lacunae]BAV08448.1 hypothetical protein FLA_4489 [Filimonas lacunae]SIT33949.1 hypothetical protein SAMN05421788_11431 [Filimonas lacunae]
MKLVSCFSFILILLLGSCKKQSSEVFVPYPTQDTVWGPVASSFIHPLDTLFTSANTETIIANATTGGTLHFSNYADVVFPAGFAANNGSVVSGNVNVSLLYLKSKGDFVRYARPTFSETDGLLDNTAAFKVSVSQNGQALDIASGSFIKLHFRIGVPFNSNNQVLNGDTTVSNTGNFTWNINTDNSLLQPFAGSDNTGNYIGYDMKCTQAGWIGCGRIADNNAADTGKLEVLLPPNFTNKNSSVYIVTRNQRSVVRVSPNLNSRTFRSANVPTKTEVILIVVGKVNGNYYTDAITFTSSNWQLAKPKPHKCSQQQMLDLLNAL